MAKAAAMPGAGIPAAVPGAVGETGRAAALLANPSALEAMAVPVPRPPGQAAATHEAKCCGGKLEFNARFQIWQCACAGACQHREQSGNGAAVVQQKAAGCEQHEPPERVEAVL